MHKQSNWNLEKFFLLLVAIIAAIAFRSYCLSLPGYSFDIGTFLSWSNYVQKEGIIKLYSGLVAIDYPPFIPLISNWWMSLVDQVGFNNIYSFKLLPTIAEIILTILAVLLIARSNIRYKVLFIVLVIVQPATAFVTSAWGQVDSIMTLLVAIAFLVIPRSLYLSSVVLALAILVKPQAAIAVFAYLAWVFFKKGIKAFIIQLLLGSFVIGLIGLLFVQRGANFLPILWESASRYPYLSMNAFNFWWLLYGTQSFALSDSLGTISLKMQGLVMFAAFISPAIYFLKARAKDPSDLFLATSYFYLVFFTFLTQMHERYLYPAVALLPFAVLNYKKAPAVYLILSATLFINCFVVLQTAFPQFFYNFLYRIDLMGDWTRLVGAINVAIAVYLALYFSIINLTGKKG